MNNFKKKSEDGFSLVEVIVASILLAMIAAGVLSVSLSSRNIINRSHLRNEAVQVAESVLSGYKAYLGQNHWNVSGSPVYPHDWWCYNLIGPDPLNLASFYGGTAFAQRHKAQWCFQVSAVPGYDYREVKVNVTSEEDRPQ